MSAVNLQEVHDFLIEVAYQAGEMITSAKPAVTGHGTKKVFIKLHINNRTALETEAMNRTQQTLSQKPTKQSRKWSLQN